jgi:nucleotide-binding universal stress UspA family protein
MKKIVVGVSGDADTHPAIEWAMQFATVGETIVELVHVVDTTWGNAPLDYIEVALLAAEEKLHDLVNSARQSYPRVAVQAHVTFGSPIKELVASANGADYLVVGAHPQGRFGGAGRRSIRLAAFAPCSVIVVPTAVVATGTGIVVGVDGSADSAAAVAFAAALADRLGEQLTAIYAWVQPELWGLVEPLFAIEPSDEDRLILAESIAGLSQDYPDLTVTSDVVPSRPEHALHAAAEGARMLVVGTRGRHGLAKAVLGSVSEALVADLPCPVAVIRGSEVDFGDERRP